MAKENIVDELDIKILKELRRDGRLSFRQLANRLNVATGTIQKRIKRMEDLDIIRGYHVSIDFEKLGYKITAVVGVIGNQESIIKLEDKLKKMSNVIGLYGVTGEYDLLIAAKFKTITELNDFIRKHFNIKGVDKTVTFIVLQTVKEERGLFE
ncbi:AsnC family transcriptional regulator [Candidatus Micrarchaeota archaeon]|nr:MAG: AsnC family transcriptional regulator [Candidatus Micrarchaeota archaeon]